MKTEYDELWDWRLENENKPIWTRSPKEVSDAAYNDFFKASSSSRVGREAVMEIVA